MGLAIHTRRALAAVLIGTAILAVQLGFSASAGAARGKTPSAKKRAQERKALLRTVKRNPRAVLRPGFMRKASLFGLDLPVTIRLTPSVDQAGTPAALDDDVVEIDLGTDPTAAPLPVGVAPGVVQSTLKGAIAGSLRFSQDPAGYGQLGAVELGFTTVQMTGTGFDLVHDAAPGGCGDPALLRTEDPVTITSAPGSVGFVNLFAGTFSMSLHTTFAFSSETRTVCTDPYTQTSLMDGSGRPAYPIRMDGTFRLTPAITADGKVRLGKLGLNGLQTDSYVQVHTCTTGPAPPATCASAGNGILPGRLKATAFSAEMLLGTVL